MKFKCLEEKKIALEIEDLKMKIAEKTEMNSNIRFELERLELLRDKYLNHLLGRPVENQPMQGQF